MGPLARLNLNRDHLPAASPALLQQTGVAFPSSNMFHSLLARTLEIHVAIVEAIRLLENYRRPTAAQVAVTPRAGSATAPPRHHAGCWAPLRTDDQGVRAARIVPPTSQNQARIEADLRRSLLQYGLNRADDKLRLRAETVIRNYDPCISCATHFLKIGATRR